MQELIISPQKEGRGRAFRALALAWVEADHLWSGGRTDTDAIRPIWAMFAGSEDELRPFVANLRSGREAQFAGGSRHEQKFECLKTAGYRWTTQRTPEGAVTTMFLPDMFLLDPGMVDPKGVAFCVLAPKAWLASQELPTAEAVAHMLALGYEPVPEYGEEPVTTEECLSALVPQAALWCAYLDRRTRCPLIADTRWYLQVLLAALDRKIARFADPKRWSSKKYRARTESFYLSDVGLMTPIVCECSHECLEAFLSEQVATYFEVTDAQRRAA